MEHLLIPYEAEKKAESGTVLVLAPHPDDEVFGCGGAIIRHVAAGDPVHVVIATDGGFQQQDGDENPGYAEVRQQESIAAAKVLGYGTPVFLGLPDRGIEYGEKLILQLLEAIGKYKPDLVYSPSIFEMHPDHWALGMSVLEAVRRTKKPVKLFLYEVGAPLRPSLLLDISDISEQKKKAMECFKSQLEVQNYSEHIQALNRFRTYTLPKNVTAAEAYMVADNTELADDPFGIYSSEFIRQEKLGLKLRPGNAPLVTVIIRSIGRESYLREALDSVALQTYPNIEVLIVNAKGEGHSDLGEWCGRFPMRICGTGEPLARSRAANFGLDNAKGEYLIFLDDDDLFDPDHLSSLVRLIGSSGIKLVAYSGVETFGQDSEPTVFNQPFDAIHLLYGNYIPIHAVLFSGKLLKLSCAFDESLDLYEDWDFWIQLSLHTNFIHSGQITARYRISDTNCFGVTQNSEAVYQARTMIFNKWRNRWSDEQVDKLMTAAHDGQWLSDELAIQREKVIALNEIISEKSRQMSELKGQVINRGTTIADLTDQLSGLRSQIAELESKIESRDVRICSLVSRFEDRDGYISALAQQLQSRDKWVSQLTTQLTNRDETIGNLLSEVRALKSSKLPSKFVRVIQLAWHRLPLTEKNRLFLKSVLFRTLPFIFKRTASYRSWKEHQKNSSAIELYGKKSNFQSEFSQGYLSFSQSASLNQPVPKLDKLPLADVPVHLIAFYLPQFHPIPENDEWWGQGFTEWNNVKSGVPQFANHYQPQEPGDLGYYDLRDISIMKQQVELATLYGLGGFCFYFYWFAGKRLLELPVHQYYENSDIDFPYCLCWANENWSRRWDGLDSEILIAQDHSPQDDLDFIEYISKYLNDSRYIRINGKPLLLVYRPSLLPSPKKTVERWRKWCRENGIGEIYLAYTQSFETVSPHKYGFDAAVEFPPNNSAPPLITDQVGPTNEGFSGNVYDWSVFVERSYQYKEEAYPIFRGVCPSWDNTARRKSSGSSIFVRNTPWGFQEWLVNAIEDTLARCKEKDERLIFVNAWNEWAEGAHLEPDSRNGYAYLEACRMAMLRANIIQHALLPKDIQGQQVAKQFSLAIAIHAFYPDVFCEILEYISRLKGKFKLFITTPDEHREVIAQLLEDGSYPYSLMVVENCGRDILPFIKILPSIIDEGHEVFLKIHTKKSTHRKDGEVWRSGIFNALLSQENMNAAINCLNNNKDIGMVGPRGHIVSMATYWGSNAQTVEWLAHRMGVSMDQVVKQPFVAGSMFYARTSALLPLLDLGLTDRDFGPESGQVDGTLAHAVERSLAISLIATGMSLVDTESAQEKTRILTEISDNYDFADKPVNK